jgi:acetate---CoA ligase (ADP-forming)
VPHWLEPLVRPKSVAIIGASADRRKTAGKPAAYLRKHGYAGAVYLVNPRYTSIDDMPSLPNIAALPEPPDVALVLLGAQAAAGAVHELAERGARSAIILAGGFAEIGEDGAARQAGLLSAAGGRLRLLGPNTIGIVNVVDRTALSASGSLELDELSSGGVGVVSQSGGMLGALLSRGTAQGVGFSRLISTGNEADVDVCDVVEYLLEDACTRVIALYLESVRRPLQFKELARRAADVAKPLVVYKVGRSEAGAQSATSHTGALAGTDRVYDALLRQVGAVRVDTLDALIDVSAALVHGKHLRGRRLGILTSTGGGGSLVADACGVRGFSVPAPDASTADRLRAALAGESTMADRNPIDLTLANLRSETYRETIGALVESPTYDGVVVVVGSSGLEDPSLAAAPVREAESQSNKPVVVYVNPSAPNIVRYLNGVGVPAFSTAEGCAAALAAMRIGEVAAPSVDPRRAPLGRTLNEAEALWLFASHGIPVVRHAVASSPEDAARAAATLGVEHVVVKILSRGIAHKSDVGGVRTNVAIAKVADVCRDLESSISADLEGWLIQEQVARGTELLLGMVRDSQLGPTLVLGAGGIATEVFGDSTLRLLPLHEDDPRDMLSELRCRVFLEGFRGQPVGDVEALFETIRCMAIMVEHVGDDLLEAEINPLFVLPRGKGVVAADGLVVLSG